MYYARGMRVVCWLGMDAMGVLGVMVEGWMLVLGAGVFLSDLIWPWDGWDGSWVCSCVFLVGLFCGVAVGGWREMEEIL